MWWYIGVIKEGVLNEAGSIFTLPKIRVIIVLNKGSVIRWNDIAQYFVLCHDIYTKKTYTQKIKIKY